MVVQEVAAVAELVNKGWRLLKQVSDSGVRLELGATLTSLHGQVIEAQTECQRLRDVIRGMEEERECRDLPEGYEYRKNAYWKGGSALCSACLENHRKERRLSQYGDDGDCATCKARYREVFYRPSGLHGLPSPTDDRFFDL